MLLMFIYLCACMVTCGWVCVYGIVYVTDMRCVSIYVCVVVTCV